MKKLVLLSVLFFGMVLWGWGQVNHLVISQTYGGGGNTGAPYLNDFVELFNPTGSSISLSGWSVQYASATGTSWAVASLSGNIGAGKYYLIKLASGGSIGAVLPTPDATNTGINMSATAGKVVLTNTTTAFTVSCPSGSSVIDLVGYGSTATCYEGSNAPAGSNTNADIRANGGCTDSNVNSSDFSTGTPNPRNSSTTANYCYAVALYFPTPSDQTAGVSFDITVASKDAGNNAKNVSSNTFITLTSNGNAGTISGTTTGTITAGSSSVIISGVVLSSAGSGVTITATATSGDVLTPYTSGTFNVTGGTNSITLSPLTQNFGPFCNSTANSVAMTFTTAGTVTSPFIELSNSSGSFASGTANLGGTVTSGSPNTITTSIPQNQSGGTYRIRIVSTDVPAVISLDNGSNILKTGAVTPSVTINDPGSVCPTQSVTFTPVPLNLGGGTASYSWTINGTPNAASGNTYTQSNWETGNSVQAVMTVTGGCVTSVTASSNLVTPTVTSNSPSVSIAITTGTNPTCAGSSITFTATPANLGGGSVSYQWKKNGSNDGNNSPNYTLTPANNDQVSCEIAVTGGCVTSNTATSGTTTITVNQIPATPTASSNSPVCAGGTLNLTSDATGTISWTGPNSFISAEQNPSITNLTTVAEGTYYVTSTVDGCTSEDETTSVVINVAPAITTHPASASITEGNNHTFTIVAAGTGLTYKWFENTIEIPSATSSSYTVTGVTLGMSGYSYTCEVSGTCAPPVISNAAILTVIPPPIAKWTFEGVTLSGTGISPTVTGSIIADIGSQTSGSSFSCLHSSSSTAWSSPAGNGSIKSISSNNWSVGDYYQFQVSTTGYKSITVSYDQTGSNTGPRDFKFQYSTDGTSYSDFTTYLVPNNSGIAWGWSSGSVRTESILSFDLSSVTALYNNATVYFRIVDNSTIAINGTTVGTGGTGRVDNFSVYGEQCAEFNGYFKYYNSASTALNNVSIELKQSGVYKYGTSTNSSGYFSFAAVCPGTYDVVASKATIIGGVNSTDAAQVNYWSVNNSFIEKVRYLAGDVNGDHSVLSGDAGHIQQYFITQGNPNPAFDSDWSFWKTGELINSNPGPSGFPAITVPAGATSVSQNFYGLITGDFNRSYVPGSFKSGSESLTLNYGQILEVNQDEEFELPLVAEMDMEVGAISLILNFPSEILEVNGVYLTNDPNTPLQFNVSGDELRIGWNALTPVAVQTGEPLLTLLLKLNGNPGADGIRLTLAGDPLNELADESFEVISNAVLTHDILKTSELGTAELSLSEKLTLSNHPNPFMGTTSFAYSLPMDGKVTLEIYDIVGNKIKVLADETQSAGDYQMKMEQSALQSGVYTATLKLEYAGNALTRTIKIVSKH